MGQYYIPIVQATKWVKDKKSGRDKFVRKVFAISPYLFGGAAKLCENATKDEVIPKFIENLMYQLQKEKWTTQLVWAGDYGEIQIATGKTLFETYREQTISKVKVVSRDEEKNEVIVKVPNVKPFNLLAEHKFYINADKQEIVNAEECKESYFSVLALLTADGNGFGGGDYFGEFWRYAGRWKGNEIIISDEPQHKTNFGKEYENDWVSLPPIVTDR